MKTHHAYRGIEVNSRLNLQCSLGKTAAVVMSVVKINPDFQVSLPGPEKIRLGHRSAMF